MSASVAVWSAPRWAQALLLASLSSLGPFSIDTYLPAFAAIQTDLGASPLEMQQTLSAYLLGFAVMNLFHGALADSFGRRPVVLTGVSVFALASLGCALSTQVWALVLFRALQGMSTGAGMVVSRAVIRDLFAPEDAQRMMSQVTIFFGVAPAVAPILGGWLSVHAGWSSVFVALTLIGVAIAWGVWRHLPETLPPSARHPLRVGDLARGYLELGSRPKFWWLALASGVPFNGMFLYVLSAPTFLGEVLGLGPTQFFWLFLCVIGGITSGAWTSGRLAGRVSGRRQVGLGFAVTLLASVSNLLLNVRGVPDLPWALLPLGLYSFGWALLVPVVTLMVLDLFPHRRGMASSLQATVGSLANAWVAGVLAPLLMHDAWALALGSAGLMAVGWVAWVQAHRCDADTVRRTHDGR